MDQPINDRFEYDPRDPTFQDDPYPTYQVLRRRHPLYRSPSGFYAISRFGDVQEASRDWRSFSSAQGVELDNPTDEWGVAGGSFIDQDPPSHDVLRRLVQHRFSPRSVAELEVVVDEIVSSRLDAMLKSGGGDFAREFSVPVAVGVMALVLGVPSGDIGYLCDLATEVERRDYGTFTIPAAAMESGRTLARYFNDLLDRPGETDPDGLLAYLRTATVLGDRVASREEQAGIAVLMLIAGTETSSSLLSSMIFWLDQYPGALSSLRSEPDLAPAAIDELLRFDPPVQNLARTTTKDVLLHGEVIPSGSRVLLVHGSANRDETVFSLADQLDFRRPATRSLAFGDGIHHCIGAPIARLEARRALLTFVNRVAQYSVCGPLVRTPSNLTRIIASLPIAFD